MKISPILSKTAFLFLLQTFTCGFALPQDKPNIFVRSLPKESIVLKLPENELGWKEVRKVMEDEYCLIERIPMNQDASKWSELIGIQITRENGINNRTTTIDLVAETIKKGIFNRYPGIRTTWNSLRKSRSELIYELILHSQFKEIPIFHEITRVFLTGDGIHRIGYTRRYGEMNKDERDKWINILEKNVSLESVGRAFEMKPAISIW